MGLTDNKFIISQGPPVDGKQPSKSSVHGDSDIALSLSHIANLANPHVTTKTQVGLGNADNTSDANKPVSTATQTALDLKADNTIVNSLIAGQSPKASCRLSSKSDGNISLTGLLTIDSVVTVNGDRINVPAQTNPIDNGLYIVGTPWVRATDFDGTPSNEVKDGDYTNIIEGTNHKASQFMVISSGSAVNVGVDPITFDERPGVLFGTTAGTSTEGNDTRLLKVNVSSNDTTPSDLVNKVTEGQGIRVVEKNDGADEDLEINMCEHFLASGSTGYFDGLALSVGGPVGTFSYTAGSGLYVDADPLSTIDAHSVTILAGTDIAVTPALLAANEQTYISFDLNGLIIQAPEFPTPEERRSQIYAGIVLHPDNVNVTDVVDEKAPAFNVAAQFHDHMLAVGKINMSGNDIVANGANLSIDKTAGSIFALGPNSESNHDNPHEIPLVQQILVSFRYRTQVAALPVGIPTTLLEPGNFDDGGVITPVGGGANSSTIQRVFMFTNGDISIQYGQEVFSTFQDAVNNAGKEAFILAPEISDTAILLASIVLNKSATSLQDPLESRIIKASRFGEASGGGASGSTVQIYGTEFEEFSAHLVTSDTTITASKSTLSVATLSKPIGKYRIDLVYAWAYDNNVDDFLGTFEINGTPEDVFVSEPTDSGAGAGGGYIITGTNQSYVHTWHTFHDVTVAGAINLELFFGGNGPSDEAGVRDVRFSIIRVS